MWRSEVWLNPYREYSVPKNKFPARAQAYEDGADAMLREVLKWLKTHHKGSHNGYGHYGIRDSEIKQMLGE